MDGNDFPVYSTNVCPRNQKEWNERSSAINCTDDYGYLCLPNGDLTGLLEFCYLYPFIWIQEGKQHYKNDSDALTKYIMNQTTYHSLHIERNKV